MKQDDGYSLLRLGPVGAIASLKHLLFVAHIDVVQV